MQRDILKKYKKEEDRLLLSKIMDKIEFVSIRNNIEYTDFLDLAQQELIKKFLNYVKIDNAIFCGGYKNAERKMLVIYPEKLRDIFTPNLKETNLENVNLKESNLDNVSLKESNLEKSNLEESDLDNANFNENSIMSVIRIELPSSLKGEYEHRNYLGAVIKLGIKREKIGDILVDENGADIIIKKEIEKFILQNLSQLTRFSKAEISTCDIKTIREPKVEQKEIKITVPSMRIDNIVSELAKCSRAKANEMLLAERVFINFEVVTKSSKEVKIGALITIRGKGRFKIEEIIGNTKKDRIVLKVIV